MLELRPIDLNGARQFVGENHRHNKPPNGHKFSIACYDGDRLCGVAMVGRPVARLLDDGLTVEVTRNCTDGTYNACSMLYGACCRAAKALGYKKIITYTLESEPGTSLKASGWTLVQKHVGGADGTGRTGSGNWYSIRCLVMKSSIRPRRKCGGKRCYEARFIWKKIYGL